MANEALRVVGENARDLTNYCGHILRSTLVIPIHPWTLVCTQFGERMWKQIQEKFEISDDQVKLQAFCLEEMRREYRGWKGRLSAHYKRYNTDEDRLANPYKEMPVDMWKRMMEHFGSPKFQEVSKRNTDNRAMLKLKHTCGPVSFVEFEHSLKDPDSGKVPDAAHVWMLEHTRKTPDGEVQWADPQSEEVHDKLKMLVTQQSQEGCTPMTNEQILLEVLGPKSGHFRGKGSGWKGHTKGTSSSNSIQQKRIDDLEERFEAERAERATERADMVAEREAERAKIVAEREADKADLEYRINERVQQEFEKLFTSRMQQLFGMHSGPASTYSQSQPRDEP